MFTGMVPALATALWYTLYQEEDLHLRREHPEIYRMPCDISELYMMMAHESAVRSPFPLTHSL